MDGKDGRDFLYTVIFYCRDLVEEIGEYPEFADQCADLVDVIGDSLADMPPADLAQRAVRALDRLAARALSLYTDNPESRYLDRVYRRVESLRDMCRSAQ